MNRFREPLIFLLLGLIAVLPFVILEYYFTNGYSFGFPRELFTMMWIQGVLFALVLRSVIVELKNSNPKIEMLLFKVALLTAITASYIFIIDDQMPCFLGGRGC